MKKSINKNLFNKTIYCIYVRNHSKDGTFNKVTEDLDRIKNLGADYLWFLPIHPIGKIKKKGSLGCPYSISDYRKVNPEYGTLEDFKNLIQKAHDKDLKIIIDVVFNHTSHDSVLSKKHPEYFYKTKDGNFGNRVGDWYDVIDLNYQNENLWEYQIETLKYWSKIGVDGFRCDVAPMIPIDFWVKAKNEVSLINPDTVWIAESVHSRFVRELRKQGLTCHSDCELYEAFDITYDYDVNEEFIAYFEGKIVLSELIKRKRSQETIYPHDYMKLRFLENHDQPRAAKLLPGAINLINWTAFTFFEKGVSLIYAGQETLNKHTPSLFDKDCIDFSINNTQFIKLIKRLAELKKHDIFKNGFYELNECTRNGVIESRYTSNNMVMIGIFNVEAKYGQYRIDADGLILDGSYRNLITGKPVDILNNTLILVDEPVIFEVNI